MCHDLLYFMYYRFKVPLSNESNQGGCVSTLRRILRTGWSKARIIHKLVDFDAGQKGAVTCRPLVRLRRMLDRRSPWIQPTNSGLNSWDSLPTYSPASSVVLRRSNVQVVCRKDSTHKPPNIPTKRALEEATYEEGEGKRGRPVYQGFD